MFPWICLLFSLFIRSLTPSSPFLYLVPHTAASLLCFSWFPSASSPPAPAPKLVLKFFFVSCPVTCGAAGPKLHLKIIFIVILSRHLQGPQFVFCPPLWETDWQLVTGRALVLLALTGSPAGGAQSHGGGSVAKPAQGGGPDVTRLCSIEIQTKPQIQDHFLETPQLETGAHPESHNSWSPLARIYVSCRKLYLCVIDWFL